MARTGRRPGTSGARALILDAARDQFAARGLDGASIRTIADEAGVDPALVHHYFGTKQRLFVAAVDIPFDVRDLLPRILTGPIEETGERFARVFFAIWEDAAIRARLTGLLRSGVSDVAAAAMIRDTILERVVGPVVESLGAGEPALRATLIGSQVLGLGLVRYILCLEPIASLPVERLVPIVAPVFQRYLLGPIGDAGYDAGASRNSATDPVADPRSRIASGA